MNDIKYHMFRSTRFPDRVIWVGEHSNGIYFIPEAVGLVSVDDNQFMSIEEIELAINDQLELMVLKDV